MLLCLLKSFMPFFKMKLYEFFSQAGADVNGKGNLASPLVIATMRGGYTDEVRLLLKAGADPNIPDDVYFLYIFLMFFRYCLLCFLYGSYYTVYYSASILCSGSVLVMIFHYFDKTLHLRLRKRDIFFDFPFY
jgi:hypothetical protein